MRTLRIASATLLLLAPAVAFAAARNFQELSNSLVFLLDNATAVLVLAGIVVYFYGISTNILKFSDDGGEKAKAYFFWGIIVLFVMLSIWGILRLLQNTLFGGGNQFSPTSPTTQQTTDGAFQSSNLGGTPRFPTE